MKRFLVNTAMVSVFALALLAGSSEAQSVRISVQAESEEQSTTSGQYTMNVTLLDYDNQLAGRKSGKKFRVMSVSPPRPCSVTGFGGIPEKEYRKFDATGCSVVNDGESVAFRDRNGDFVLARVVGAGKERHSLVRDSTGKVIWERWGALAFFTDTGALRCQVSVTDSAQASFHRVFSGACSPLIGRDVSIGVYMITPSGSVVSVDVTKP